MVYVYLEDTGHTALDVSDTEFTAYTSATQTEIEDGEFKADSRVLLKITSLNYGDKNNLQSLLPLTGNLSSSNKVSSDVIKFSIGGYINKPSTFTGTDTKDLPNLKQLLLMRLSNGHKDLYLSNNYTPNNEALFSLKWLIELYGVQDAGNTDSAKHLNVIVESFSFNEGVNTLNYTINVRIIPSYKQI